MSLAYYCKVCGQLDAEGISGHATARCKPVANKAPKVANKVTLPVANEKPRKVYKDKEARLAYMRNLMRKRRAEAKARA